MSFNEKYSSEKVGTGNNDAKDEWGSEPPTLVQRSGNGRPDQATNRKTHRDDAKLTPKVLFGGGVTPTENGSQQVTPQAKANVVGSIKLTGAPSR
jgi:hypothetical protein